MFGPLIYNIEDSNEAVTRRKEYKTSSGQISNVRLSHRFIYDKKILDI